MTKTKRFVTLGILFWTLAIFFLIIPIWPQFYYRLSPKASDSLAQTLSNTITQETPTTSPTNITPTPSPTIELPEVDPTLPKDNGLIIESIGVRGEIHEGDDWQNILKKGIWRAPNFGNPETPGTPIIIAAHRWGYVSWSNAFRKLNSFFNLPKLKEGDTVEIVWNQRKFRYAIYKSETGEKISDYTADLILYTCELWNSPTRIFKYARLTGE